MPPERNPAIAGNCDACIPGAAGIDALSKGQWITDCTALNWGFRLPWRVMSIARCPATVIYDKLRIVRPSFSLV